MKKSSTILLRLKIIFFMTITILYIDILHGQYLDPADGYVQIPTPENWNFRRYGNLQPSLYTGSATFSLPVYTYKDLDFELPISLDYSTNGYMPNVQAGIAGLGWNLSVGGMITRSVNNIPDEDTRAEIKGYQWLHKGQGNDPEVFLYDNKLRIYPDLYPCYFWIMNDKTTVETEADMFSFSFTGHSGKFMMGPKSFT